MRKILKSKLNQLNFALGRNPIVEKRADWRNFVPEPYKAVLLLSADFELAWAWRYTKSHPNPLEKAIAKTKTERENVPKILRLCEQYDIPITWATVGHLFLESCKKNSEGFTHTDLSRLPNFENEFWKFQGRDWFEHDPGTDYKTNPEWYCPDLIQQIIDSPVKHEMACHTFSHIDCRDHICDPHIIREELKLCKKVAAEKGLSLKSFVHPGHTIGNLDVLIQEDFTNFRTDYRNMLGYPKKFRNRLWELEQTAEFNYRADWSVDYHIHRYIKIIQRAIDSNTVCVLWFHPSFHTIMIDKIWPEIFMYIHENKDKIWNTSHCEYIKWLNKNNFK